MFTCTIASLLTGIVLFELMRRISRAEADAAGVTAAGAADGFSAAVREFCCRVIQADLLPDATGPGMMDLPVRFRLHNDSFSRIGQLLTTLASKSQRRGYADTAALVRLFYQLAYSLDARPADAVPVLGILERRLIENDGTKAVGRVGRVQAGERFDAQTMTYLRNGTHVDQPFGFVVYSPEGKVIGKAEVLCR